MARIRTYKKKTGHMNKEELKCHVCACYMRGKRRGVKKTAILFEQLNLTGQTKCARILQMNMPWRENHVLAQLKTISHRLRCET
jgi:hypothetical protein